ncbi:hypothetical protein C8J57DRAFT_1535586 [Mycena rebaudengoi]|nr:hypothetical protein C8J57DRAFT_1535586 [Mycena rebaudengoi]
MVTTPRLVPMNVLFLEAVRNSSWSALTAMFARLSVLAILVALVSNAMIDKRAAPINQLVGYATLNGGTTGGAGGPTTIVTSLAALRTAVTGATPKIVEISGIITGDGETIDVGNHTTVVGIGSNSGVTGGGFRVKMELTG